MIARRALVAVALLATACAPVSAPRPAQVQADAWVQDRLYFGRSIAGGGEVSDAEWAAFVRDVATAAFPDGMTVYGAEGQWRNEAREVVREATMVVEIYHPARARADSAIQAVAREYVRRFRQSSVLHARVPAQVRFLDSAAVGLRTAPR